TGSKSRDSGFGIRDSALLVALSVVTRVVRVVVQVFRPAIFALAAALLVAVSLAAQEPQKPLAAPVTDYVVGPQDVLMITSYDQADLSGKFAVEADGTFTYPMIGRFRAGGLTLRQVESGLKKKLVDD